MQYDVIIIGAGPGGIFSAYELSKLCPEKRIAVFEEGQPLEKRRCPIDGKTVKHCVGCPTCAIMNGFGGAGAFSDGKYNLTNDFGGTLYEYIGKKQAMELMHYVDEINVSHGGENTKLYSTANSAFKTRCLQCNLHLLDASVRHLGTDINFVVLKNLFAELAPKVDFYFRTPVRQVLTTDGGYEIVSGHRRQKASELAGFTDMPCIVRNLTDEQAITQMVEDNTNQRENILPSERAKALKMQLEAIKHQGAKEATSGQLDPKDAGRRSNEIVAERNKMTVKQVQRYIKLNDLVPDLQKMMDAGQIKFTPAVELAYIKPKNQRYIAVAIESQQSAPSLSQAQRMRELDQKGVLNGDVIDGIMMEDKKEVDKVILTGAELSKYFGKEATPREMKDQIIKLLDDWKGQQKEVAKPEKKAAQQEK